MRNPRDIKAALMVLGPEKVISMAIAATVWLVATCCTVRPTDHQQAPAIAVVVATASVRLVARCRQATKAIVAQATAATTLTIPTRSNITVGPRSDRPGGEPAGVIDPLIGRLRTEVRQSVGPVRTNTARPPTLRPR